MRDPSDGAWRELSEAEAAALEPVTIHVEGLDDDAVTEVDARARSMFCNSVIAFYHQFQRQPDEREAELLARAVASHVNRYVIPELRARAVLH